MPSRGPAMDAGPAEVAQDERYKPSFAHPPASRTPMRLRGGGKARRPKQTQNGDRLRNDKGPPACPRTPPSLIGRPARLADARMVPGQLARQLLPLLWDDIVAKTGPGLRLGWGNAGGVYTVRSGTRDGTLAGGPVVVDPCGMPCLPLPSHTARHPIAAAVVAPPGFLSSPAQRPDGIPPSSTAW